FVAGHFNGTFTLGSQTFESPSGMVDDLVVAGFTPAGALVAVTAFTSTANDFSDNTPQLAAGPTGALLVTGTYHGNLTVGGRVLTAKSFAIYLAALDPPSLVPTWTHSFDGGGNYAQAVAVDGCGQTVVTGFLTSQVDFGCGPLPGSGDNELFVARFAP